MTAWKEKNQEHSSFSVQETVYLSWFSVYARILKKLRSNAGEEIHLSATASRQKENFFLPYFCIGYESSHFKQFGLRIYLSSSNIWIRRWSSYFKWFSNSNSLTHECPVIWVLVNTRCRLSNWQPRIVIPVALSSLIFQEYIFPKANSWIIFYCLQYCLVEKKV